MRAMLTCVGLFAGLVAAQGTPYSGPWELLKGEYDENGDGKVTAKEYPRGETRFGRLDRDGDGYLTAKDFQRGGGRNRRGGGRRLTPAQLAGRCLGRLMDPQTDVTPKDVDRWFADLDTDESGGLRQDELTCVSNVWRRQSMRVLDKDRDDAITLAEVRAAFTLADRDGSGTLSKAEYARTTSRRGRRAAPPAPKVGQAAPDFTLRTLDGKRKVTLSSHKGKAPVALIFGSYT